MPGGRKGRACIQALGFALTSPTPRPTPKSFISLGPSMSRSTSTDVSGNSGTKVKFVPSTFQPLQGGWVFCFSMCTRTQRMAVHAVCACAHVCMRGCCRGCVRASPPTPSPAPIFQPPHPCLRTCSPHLQLSRRQDTLSPYTHLYSLSTRRFFVMLDGTNTVIWLMTGAVLDAPLSHLSPRSAAESSKRKSLLGMRSVTWARPRGRPLRCVWLVARKVRF